MTSINVTNTVAGLIVGLFLLRVLQHLLANSQNPIAVGVVQGLTFLIG